VWKSFYFDDRYTPSHTQKRLVQAGYLGKKSNIGFYDYREGASNPTPQNQEPLLDYIANRILCMLINEAADTVSRGICSLEDVELAALHGVNYPKGLMAWAEEIGIDHIVKTLDYLYDRYHN
jgi:3-hydroxybutyryl-CoA dehydrogenase